MLAAAFTHELSSVFRISRSAGGVDGLAAIAARTPQSSSLDSLWRTAAGAWLLVATPILVMMSFSRAKLIRVVASADVLLMVRLLRTVSSANRFAGARRGGVCLSTVIMCSPRGQALLLAVQGTLLPLTETWVVDLLTAYI